MLYTSNIVSFLCTLSWKKIEAFLSRLIDLKKLINKLKILVQFRTKRDILDIETAVSESK